MNTASMMQQRVATIFDGINLSSARATLVESLPQPRAVSVSQLQGIHRLAEAVVSQQQQTVPAPPTFMFLPISFQPNYSPTVSEEVSVILERSIHFLRMHSSFHLELVLDTTNDERHRELHTVLSALPSSSFPPARFRLLVSSQYPVVNESTADIVSTSAVYQFSAAGSSMNRTLHRMYKLAAAETAGHSESLQQLTNKCHKRCKPNNSYVVDVPTGVRLSSSNGRDARHIVHTMGTNNMFDAYTNMFNAVQAVQRHNSNLYCMAGSLGNLKPDFLCHIENAMAGDGSKLGGDWHQVVTSRLRLCVLWPSKKTAGNLMSVLHFGNLRAMPADHWKNHIPVQAKNKIFFDAKPNPSPDDMVEQKRLPAGHAKVLLLEEDGRTTCYIGSHNLSKSAWGDGSSGSAPHNVELGVVLCSADPSIRRQWRERLPCELPSKEDLERTAADREYVPAGLSPYHRDELMKAQVEGSMSKMLEVEGAIRSYFLGGQ